MDQILRYLPGLAFLALASGIVALPCALFLRRPIRSILLSVIVTTLVLKSWAYLDMGGFDLSFLGVVLLIATVVATLVTKLVGRVRGRHALPGKIRP